MKNTEVEILAPAGSYDSLRAGLDAGADAVYMGGSRFGARAYADNFTEEEMLSAIDEVHLRGRKIYLTVNTLLKDGELEELFAYLNPFYLQGLDAVIVQDMGVFRQIRRMFPGLSIHASTQMTITNALGARFLEKEGANRVVPARELSLQEIRRIKEETNLEVECFVHGALCYCYSGQCLLSSVIGGRSGNRGQCAQPCRLPYRVEGKKPQDIMSLKDLCTLELLPELVDVGIDSLKIEGRMKQPDYVYTVVSMYRKYLDLYQEKGKETYRVLPEDLLRLKEAYQRRGYTKGYYEQHNGKDMLSLQRPKMRESVPATPSDVKHKEKINGKLILSAGMSAKLILTYGDTEVEAEGAQTEQAKKQPLSKERVDRQMRKTGETSFAFDQLQIEMDEKVFLPMQALNELRRTAIAALEAKVLSGYRREMKSPQTATKYTRKTGRDESKALSASRGTEITVQVSTFLQLTQAVQNPKISEIYVDSAIGFAPETVQVIHAYDACDRCYLAMPYIFREQAIRIFEGRYTELQEHYCGVMIRSWESYEWLKEKEYDKIILSDYNLYAFNQSAKCFLKEKGIAAYTVPVELNARELEDLQVEDGILIVYGYQPVMVTANCIRKNTAGCDRKEGILKISDRKQKEFAVKNVCPYCYNIIYNSVPLMLLGQKQEIDRLGPAKLRLDFLNESPEEFQKVTDLFLSAFQRDEQVSVPAMEYTNGHFKRGVK